MAAGLMAESAQVKIRVPGSQPMVALLGQRDELLKLVESAFARSSRRKTRSVSPWFWRSSKFGGSRKRSDFDPSREK